MVFLIHTGLIFISFRCFSILELMKKNLIYLKTLWRRPTVIQRTTSSCNRHWQHGRLEKERGAECCFKGLRIMHLPTFWIFPLLNEKHLNLYLDSSNTSLFSGLNIAYKFNNKWAHDELQATKLSSRHYSHGADQLKFAVYFPAWIKFHYI